ncbi:MAG TPA: hypothetical protein VFH01_10105 [Pyrinomonadaceae bacterium]|nr:hypothetical protein [Pyrinomonadaceae bacterium]
MANANKASKRNKATGKERPVFDSIRKPSAPPGHPMSHAKPDEKARPAARKAKHKQKLEFSASDDQAD